MRLLHWVIAREEYLCTKKFPENKWGARPGRAQGAGDGIVSALWSDVGPRIYSECGVEISDGSEDGWVVREPVSTVWKLGECVVPKNGREDGVEWLDEKSAEEIWNDDGERIKVELLESAAKANESQFSFLPSGGVAAFQWFRLHYHFSRYVDNAPKHWGVRIGGKAHERRTFATWTFEYRPGSLRTLIVTRLRADESTIRLLVENILRYALRYGMEKVEVWNLGRRLEAVIAGLGGQNVYREDYLSSIKWYGQERVEWKNNERFCWC